MAVAERERLQRARDDAHAELNSKILHVSNLERDREPKVERKGDGRARHHQIDTLPPEQSEHRGQLEPHAGEPRSQASDRKHEIAAQAAKWAKPAAERSN